MGVPVVILAGGRGARFDHESQVLPKPLIEVAGKPMLGHIMDLFEAQGFNEFIILGGHMVDKVNDYVATRYECRVTPPRHEYITVFGNKGERVKTHVFDTGEDATTGDRLFSMLMDFMPHPLDNPRFFLTYGDGLSDVDLNALLAFHDEYVDGNARMTVTAVRPPGRFGVIETHPASNIVSSFGEKPAGGLINGGFMVLDQGIIARYVPRVPFDDGPFESFESGAMVRAAAAGNMRAFRHEGYWRCMDTRRDLEQIEADVKISHRILPWRKDMPW
jgi:glucose-1-phosphate cytidylyltransferase